jgi:methanogenic corrinoid protein MtbC1
MASVFALNNYELLVRTVVWVYRAYRSRGFSYDYFASELEAWFDAVRKYLPPPSAEPIGAVYRWMCDHHRDFVELAGAPPRSLLTLDPGWQPFREEFLAALRRGDHRAALRMSEERVKDARDVVALYLEVFQPAMYEIGAFWECGDVSVAQEHLATAIVGRIMASLYPQILGQARLKGRAVITAVPNEQHELGARMAADLLEIDGWDVRYLGANTPIEDLLLMIQAVRPVFVGLSVSVTFNVHRAQQVVSAIRSVSDFQNTRVLAGGRVFLEMPRVGGSIGADGVAGSATEAVEVARQWWKA